MTDVLVASLAEYVALSALAVAVLALCVFVLALLWVRAR